MPKAFPDNAIVDGPHPTHPCKTRLDSDSAIIARTIWFDSIPERKRVVPAVERV